MKKLFLLALSFMLILSISVVFINVGNMDFADTPAGSISQSPVGADITLEDEGADISVSAVGIDNASVWAGVENGVANWVLDAQYTDITDTIVVPSGYTLNITTDHIPSSGEKRSYIRKSSGWYGPHFQVEQGGTLNISGYDKDHNIVIESQSRYNTSPQVEVLNKGNGSAVIDFEYVQLSNNYTGTADIGGGIYLNGSCSKVEITNCNMWCFGKYSSSTSYSLGGEASAIRFTKNFKYTGEAGTAPLIQNCEFDECYSTYGGTIRYEADTNNGLKIINNIFKDPGHTLASNGGFISIEGGSATDNIDIIGNTFTSGSASNSGGAVYLGAGAKGVVNFHSSAEKDSYITGGSANYGGGIAASANITDDVVINLGSDNSNFTIASSKANPTSNGLGMGGAVYIGSDKVTVNVNDKAHIGVNISDQDRGNSANKGGAFYVANGTLNIKGGKVNYNDSTVSSSYNGDHEGSGGAICAQSGTVNITGGNIKANLASMNGGAITGYGTSTINISGGVIGTETTTSTDWSNYINKATGNGGAVYINGNDSKLNISGNALIQTSTASNGGSVYCVGGTFKMSGGKLSNATANFVTENDGYGAGLYLSNCALVEITGGEITGCTGTFGGGISVYGTKENSINIIGGKIHGNTAHRYGGGIYIHKNSNVVVGGDAEITNNKINKELDTTDASFRRGGGIYVGDGGSLKLCGNATISNNDAFMGGGIYFCNAVSAVIDGTEAESPVISGNHAGDSGGGIVVDGCTLKVNYANILDNVAEVEAVVYSSGSEDIQTDEKNFGGGGILLWLEENVSYLEFYNGIMSGNMAWDGSGGAICSSRKWNTDKNKGYITIWDGKFTSNQAGNGGAIYADYLSELTMYGGTIGGIAKDDNDYKTIASNNPSAYPPIKVPKDANYALGCADTDGDGVTDEGDGDFGGGGGLYIRGTAVLKNVEIVGNLAAKGAGIDLGTSEYTYDKKIYSGTVTSINSSYIYNRATDNGGGVYLTDCDLTKTVATFPTFTSKNDDICHNRAVNGGGIYCGSRTNVNLYGAYVNENILRYYDPSSNGQIVYGGGIYSRGAKLKTANSVDEAYDNGIDDGEDNYVSGRTCQIADNKACDSEDNEANIKYKKATITGGALFSDALATNDLSYTYIGGNEAYNLGGGLYVASTKGLSYSNSKAAANAYTKIDHCTISGNTLTATHDDSKGIKSNGAGIFSTITSNSQANYYTYPNYINNNAQFTLTNSTISNNKCSGFGGGLYVDYYYQDTNTELLHNNKIYNNTAGYGAGINFGDCAGIGKDVTMTATDIYGNVATGEGGGIRSNGHIIFKRSTVTNEDTGEEEIRGNIYNNKANLGGGLYANKGTFVGTTLITNNVAVIGGGVYSVTADCTINLLEDNTAPIYGNFADPVEGSSLESQGDDVYAKSGATLVFPAKANYDTNSDKFGIWYSDYNTDRFRTGPDLISNALIINVTTTSGNYRSNGEVAATFHLPSAKVSLGVLEALDPWGNEYDPQVNGDSKYQYEFVICKGDKILSKEDFIGDNEFIAYSITANGKTEYKHFKDSETGSVFVSPGETFSIGGLVAGLQLKMFTPADSKIKTSFVKSVNASYDWGDEVVRIATEDVKSGLTVVKNITTDAIPALDTIKSYTASVTNNIFGTKVTINYYDREVAKGVAADISSTPTKVTKTYLGPDYVDNFNNSYVSDTYQLNNFSHMITGAGVSANNKARGIDNIVDQYYLWHSQAGAVSGVKNTIYPGTELTYEEYFGTSVNFANHTDADGKFVTTDNSKWVTYATASNAEVTPGVYQDMDNFNELKYVSSNEPVDIHSVNQIDVWLFNTPKVYNIKVYSAQREGHLENRLDNGMYASTNLRGRFSSYYNQRFNGELGDASDEASEHLKKYNNNIKGYIDEYISTSYRIRGVDDKDVYFQYWSYDPEGKVVASTDISYAHRVTADVELYAIYGQGEFWDAGLTLLENSTDFYHKDVTDDSGNTKTTEYVRFNTINTPYNTIDVDYAASVTLMIDGEPSINKDRLRDDLNAYLTNNFTFAEESMTKGSYTLDDLKVYNTNGSELDATIVLDVFEIVDKITDSSDDYDITKTSLDRVQFYKEYKLSDVVNKTILSLGGMHDDGSWYVSTNCVENFISDIELDFDVEGDLGVGDGDIDWS